MAKKYYWLKLKEDFFRNKKIKKLRKIAGGDTYTVIYLKMQLLSLQNEGMLIYEGVEESFADEVALEIDEDIDNVKITISFLVQNGLLEETEQNHFVMTETIECIGSESDSTERVRRMRARKRLLGEPEIDEKRYGGNGKKALERDGYKCVMCGSADNICIHHNNGMSNNLEDLVTLCRKCHSNVEQKNVTCNALVTTGNTEIEKEKEIDIDLEKDKKKEKKESKKDSNYDSIINELVIDEDIKEALYEFIKMRKLIKKPMTDRALRQLINKLYTLSANKEEQLQILDNSIINNWSSLYPLKKENNNNGYKRTEIVPDWFKQENSITAPDENDLAELEAFTDELEPFEVRKQALQEKLRSKYGKNDSNTIIN